MNVSPDDLTGTVVSGTPTTLTAPSGTGAPTMSSSSLVNSPTSPLHNRSPTETAEDDSGALEAICEANGWSQHDVNIDNRHKIRFLELFILQFAPSVPQLCLFVNLVEIRITHCGLTRIAHLDKLCCLEVLWFSENEITKIEGLDGCTSLRELYLHNNKIKNIENLERLRGLRTLWLGRNEIEEVEGLENLCQLENFSIAANRISSLYGVFDGNPQLNTLNVSGNKLASFKDLVPLKKLTNLSVLYLSDPIYGENPVCNLSNYRTFLLFHVPQLSAIDFETISIEQRGAAESTFFKKKIYYSMRIQTLLRNEERLCRKTATIVAGRLRDIQVSIDVLRRTREEMQHMIELHPRLTATAPQKGDEQPDDGATGSGGGGISKTPLTPALFKKKLTAVESALASRNRERNSLRAELAETLSATSQASRSYIARLLLELNSGGNIRLEEGRPKDVWYQSCVELVRTRFFQADFDALSIKELRVGKVTRIHNRTQRTKFDTALGNIVDLTDPSYKRALEYLFVAVPQSTTTLDMADYYYTIVEKGLGAAVCGGSSEAIPLTNSVFLADQVRLLHCHNQGKLSAVHNMDVSALSVKIVVVKVFLGRCGAEKTNPSSPVDPDALCRANLNPKDYPGIKSVYRYRGKDQKQRVWFCLDPSLVLPEYIIEAAYVSSSALAPLSPLLAWGPNKADEVNQTFKEAFAIHPVAGGGGGAWNDDNNSWPGGADSAVSKIHPLPISHSDLLDFKQIGMPFLSCRKHLLPFGGGNSSNGNSNGGTNSSNHSSLAQKEATEALSMPTDSYALASIQELNDDVILMVLGHHVEKLTNGATTGKSSSNEEEEGVKEEDNTSATTNHNEKRKLPHQEFKEDSLSLSCCGIKHINTSKLGHVCVFNNMTNLALSHNALDVVPWTALARLAPNLISLDLSYNSIRRIRGLEKQTHPSPSCWKSSCLKNLNLEANLLVAWQDVDSLVDMFPTLQTLSLQGNPLDDLVGCCSTTNISSTGGSSPDRTTTRANNNVDDCSSYHSAVVDHSHDNYHQTESLWQFLIARLPSLHTLDGMSVSHWVASHQRHHQQKSVESLSDASLSSSELDDGRGGTSRGGGISSSSNNAEELLLKQYRCLHECDESSVRGVLRRVKRLCREQKVTIKESDRSEVSRIFGIAQRMYAEQQLQRVCTVQKGDEEEEDDEEDPLLGATVYYGENLCITSLGCFLSASTRTPSFHHLTHLNLSGNCIRSLQGSGTSSPMCGEGVGIPLLPNLEVLDLSRNRIQSMKGVGRFAKLRRLDLTQNEISEVEDINSLVNLHCLALNGNHITQLKPLTMGTHLVEVYLSYNDISNEKEVCHLRDMPKLIIADFLGNPFNTLVDSYRLYVVYQVKRLKVLDGTSVDATETQLAKDTFSGRISAELLNERLPGGGSGIPWNEVREINLASCALREITLLSNLTNLVHLRLEFNQLVSIDGLRYCVHLATLNLSHNKLGISSTSGGGGGGRGERGGSGGGDSPTPAAIGLIFAAMPLLESLSLEANAIQSVSLTGHGSDDVGVLVDKLDDPFKAREATVHATYPAAQQCAHCFGSRTLGHLPHVFCENDEYNADDLNHCHNQRTQRQGA